MPGGKGRGLQGRGNVRSRVHQKSAGNANNPFVRGTTRISWEFSLGLGGDILPDDGKVSIFELKEIRASSAAGTQTGFGSRSKSSKCHGFKVRGEQTMSDQLNKSTEGDEKSRNPPPVR